MPSVTQWPNKLGWNVGPFCEVYTGIKNRIFVRTFRRNGIPFRWMALETTSKDEKLTTTRLAEMRADCRKFGADFTR